MNKDIQDYYKQVKDKYPDISLKQFSDICNSPFKLVKEVMNNNNLKDIRLQYLGSFKVSSFRINKVVKSFTNRLDKGKITEDKFKQKTSIYNEYIEIKNKSKEH